MASVYEIITQRIVELLEKGTVPWHKPWKGASQIPKNLVSGREYRGVNVFVLASAGFETPWWLSFRQAIGRGGHVKKGTQGFPVIYWNWTSLDGEMQSESEDAEKEARPPKRKTPFVRYYTVFNVLQTEGVEYPKTEATESRFTPLEVCEQVVESYKNPPKIETLYEKAFYRPSQDLVGMPSPDKFDRTEDYYSTLFHELSHSTGHSSRLARRGIMERTVFASNDYSKEELVAEMGAAFLCGHSGIESRIVDSSASYINSWLGRLRNDKRLVIEAASQAQRSTDYILNKRAVQQETTEEGQE